MDFLYLMGISQKMRYELTVEMLHFTHMLFNVQHPLHPTSASKKD